MLKQGTILVLLFRPCKFVIPYVYFESQWIYEPGSVHGNKVFDNDEFKNYLSIYDISFRPFPPRRNYKNVIESKHRILRDIYLR